MKKILLAITIGLICKDAIAKELGLNLQNTIDNSSQKLEAQATFGSKIFAFNLGVLDDSQEKTKRTLGSFGITANAKILQYDFMSGFVTQAKVDVFYNKDDLQGFRVLSGFGYSGPSFLFGHHTSKVITSVGFNHMKTNGWKPLPAVAIGISQDWDINGNSIPYKTSYRKRPVY